MSPLAIDKPALANNRHDKFGTMRVRRECDATKHGIRASDPGFALVITLFALVLVSYLVTQLAAIAHRELLLAANLRAAAQADTIAEGLVFEAAFRVLAGQWAADGLPHIVRQAPARMAVRIVDEAGRIDLNVAPLPLLRALLRACHADNATAAHVAAAIIDWRRPNLPPLPGGAKAPQYQRLGFGYGPPNSRFEQVPELAQVLGVTPALYGCMAPHVTVYTGSNPVAGLADPLVAVVMSDAYPDGPVALIGGAHQVGVIRVTAAVAASGGGQAVRTAVIRFTPADRLSPYRVLWWE